MGTGEDAVEALVGSVRAYSAGPREGFEIRGPVAKGMIDRST